MEEKTKLRSQGETLVDQQMNTGGVRTYLSHVRGLSEAKKVTRLTDDGSKKLYRFVINIPYEDPTDVKGVLTCTIAEWRVLSPSHMFSSGCYVRNISFESKKVIVDVVIIAKNLEVEAINIEGRIVEGENVPL